MRVTVNTDANRKFDLRAQDKTATCRLTAYTARTMCAFIVRVCARIIFVWCVVPISRG